MYDIQIVMCLSMIRQIWIIIQICTNTTYIYMITTRHDSEKWKKMRKWHPIVSKAHENERSKLFLKNKNEEIRVSTKVWHAWTTFHKVRLFCWMMAETWLTVKKSKKIYHKNSSSGLNQKSTAMNHLGPSYLHLTEISEVAF